MIKVNPVQLQKNLNQVNYPLSKKDLVKYGEEKGIDEQILRALKRLPSKQYATLAEVSKFINESIIPKLSPVQLETNLNEINYPVSKKDLIRYGEEKGIDEQVLRALKLLPSKQFATLAEVSKFIGK